MPALETYESLFWVVLLLFTVGSSNECVLFKLGFGMPDLLAKTEFCCTWLLCLSTIFFNSSSFFLCSSFCLSCSASRRRSQKLHGQVETWRQTFANFLTFRNTDTVSVKCTKCVFTRLRYFSLKCYLCLSTAIATDQEGLQVKIKHLCSRNKITLLLLRFRCSNIFKKN